jgi:Holliday junction resolvasome RuvABC endonuclease subunit
VQAAVKTRLKLAAAPHPPDVADCLAIALCYAARQEVNSKMGVNRVLEAHEK